jgi:hypothetical protein
VYQCALHRMFHLIDTSDLVAGPPPPAGIIGGRSPFTTHREEVR